MFYSSYLKRREENSTTKTVLKRAGEGKENLVNSPYSLAHSKPDRTSIINCF